MLILIYELLAWLWRWTPPWRHEAGAALGSLPLLIFTSPAVTEPTKFLTSTDYRRYSGMRIASALRLSSGMWHRAFCTIYDVSEADKRIQNVLEASTQRKVSPMKSVVGIEESVWIPPYLSVLLTRRQKCTYNVTFRCFSATIFEVGKQ
jgi:hypothetical protein